MTNQPVTMVWDDVTFLLKEQHNLDWIRSLGKVFCVFDQQDSGNLSFGIEEVGKKRFVKYAGARTTEYTGEPQEAVANLKMAMPLYEQLIHPHLVELIDHYPVEEGYAAIFEWFDGACLHPHWSFPPPAKYTHPDSPFFQFKQLPLHHRLTAMESIIAFHVHVEANDYVAVDFYDGSILYDFKSNTTKICDIDCYRKKPFINNMGRLWGSSRFISPEEFQLGADIDGRTNVFNMGATAFCLFGGERDRDFSKWDAGRELYEAALQAVEPSRDHRYPSVADFYKAWKRARLNETKG